MTTEDPVLVIGAGPAGLTMALLLAKNSIPVRVIEKNREAFVGCRGPAIWPRTLEIHKFLGTLDDFEAGSRVVPPVANYATGVKAPVKVFELYPVKGGKPDIPWPNVRFIAQSRHQNILMNHLSKHGVQIEFSTELKSFEQDEHSVTATVFKNGCETSTIKTPYLVSTEGAHSSVRKSLGLGFLGETTTETMLIGDIHIEGLDPDHWHFFGNPAAQVIMLYPTGEPGPGWFGYIITGKQVDIQKSSASEEALIELISTVAGPELKYGQVMGVSIYNPHIRMVTQFSKGRCFVAGDAGHVHSLAGGQGLNSSIQDSFNLGWKLTSVLRKISPPTLLETYSTERLPVIAEMLNKTTLLHKQMHSSSSCTQNEVEEEKEKESGLKAQMHRPEALNMLGINYRSSPIVVDTIPRPHLAPSDIEATQTSYVQTKPGLWAGDRAPEAPFLRFIHGDRDRETGIFDILNCVSHTALIFASSVEAAAPSLDKLTHLTKNKIVRLFLVLPGGIQSEGIVPIEDAVLLEDTKGHAKSAYLTPNNIEQDHMVTVLIRPDAYIGGLLDGTLGMDEYLAHLFLPTV